MKKEEPETKVESVATVQQNIPSVPAEPEVSIKDILLKQSYVSAEDMAEAELFVSQNGVTIEDYLINNEIITKDLLGQALAESKNVSYIDLNSKLPGQEQVLKIPEDIARKFNVVLYDESNEKVALATDFPNQPGLKEALSAVFPNKQIVVGYSLPEDIKSVFKFYRKPLVTRFEEITKSADKIAVGIIEEILEDSLVMGSSDIHIEPQDNDEVIIRFRVDGVLQEVARIQKLYFENVLNWLKVKSHMRIDEHFSAQDGSIRYKKDEYELDLRISIIPTINGEKVVMRLLSRYVGGMTFASLGINPSDQQILLTAAKAPFGMILVTGPTGSGKSTTLYALMKLINRPEINITTIEDPVEYRIKGVNHIQVNKDTNLTFVNGLRSIVRQDPDVILVGEIRDVETAEIAVNAALTGHLLLSSFHANDAPTAIPRLLDMGIEHFLLSSTLQLIVAQRLVRKICEGCRYSTTMTVDQLKEILPTAERYFTEKNNTIYKGKGCKSCSGTGYKGRIGIYEFVKNTTEMQDLILTNPSSNQIWDLAKTQGTKSFFEDGILKVKSGVTTLEELMRVAHVANS